MATNSANASFLALTAQQPPVTLGQSLLSTTPFGGSPLGNFFAPPVAGTPGGNVETMMLGMLGESAQGQGMMMNFLGDMIGSYDKMMGAWMGMLGIKAPAAAAPKK